MEFSKTAYQFLKVSNINISSDYFTLRIQSHSDYPSLLSLTDTFEEFSLEYKAVMINQANLIDIKYPVLAKSSQLNAGFQVIQSPAKIELNSKDFPVNWEGPAIILKPDQKITNPENKEFQEQKLEILTIQFIIAFTSLLFILYSSAYNFTWGKTGFNLLSIFGMFISWIIFQQSHGRENSFTRQLCSANKGNSCSGILNSKRGRISKHTAVIDFAIVYFVSQIIFSIISSLSSNSINYSQITLPYSAIALLVSLISILYQWKIIKAWCRMCLIISLIIWGQFLLALFLFAKPTVSDLPLFSYIQIAGAILFGAIWFMLKPIINQAELFKKTRIELLAWKRNQNIFQALLKDQKSIGIQKTNNPFHFGKSNSPMHITLVSSLSCNPCADAYKKISALSKKHPDVLSFSVIFSLNPLLNNQQINKRKSDLKSILNNLPYYTPNELLDSWYNTMDSKKWHLQFGSIEHSDTTDEIIEGYLNWNKNNFVTYTPAIYLNNKEFPNVYRIEDLENFVPYFREKMQKNLTTDAFVA